MLNIPHALSPKLSRRRWLQLGGLGVLGLSLPRLLQAGERRRPVPVQSCVLFLLHGGPSQLDIWDMKPAAPQRCAANFTPSPPACRGFKLRSICRSWPGRRTVSA